MKTIIILALNVIVVTTCLAQQIETKSITIDNLISFVVDNYHAQDLEQRNITFLIQVREDKMDGENLVILKQGFKLISSRLNINSKLSIGTYSKFNGIALQPTSIKEEKLILHTLSDLKGSIAEFYQDGIDLGYKHAEQNFQEGYKNTIVMIRVNNKAQNDVVDIEKEEKKVSKKKKNKALLVTALALLPELINVIKD